MGDDGGEAGGGEGEGEGGKGGSPDYCRNHTLVAQLPAVGGGIVTLKCVEIFKNKYNI